MGGAKKRPFYKIVVADSRFPRDGRFIEKVGFFNPLLPKAKKERVNLEVERIKHWISKGAKPTLRVSRILGEAQLYPMPPKGNNPLKAIPKKDRTKIEVERVKYWMSQGAKPTTRVARILGEAEIIPMPTPGNNPLKGIPKKDRKKIEKDSTEDTKKEAVPKAEEKKDKK